ncbi:hypothetical protein [Yoonia maritima]|uniref:hypothetical protein n=1 Tax=Yoonia maritima TaxID=1435347 RepID=UPI00373705C8
MRIPVKMGMLRMPYRTCVQLSPLGAQVPYIVATTARLQGFTFDWFPAKVTRIEFKAGD